MASKIKRPAGPINFEYGNIVGSLVAAIQEFARW